jgi:hypothetical protein
MRNPKFSVALLIFCGTLLFGCGSDDPTTAAVKLTIDGIGEIEIAGSDIKHSEPNIPSGLMNWETANQKASAVGPGWRLPTIQEWEKIYFRQSEIPNLSKSDAYWSESEYDSDAAYLINFPGGAKVFTGKLGYCRARAIRILKSSPQ